jgi:DNA-binding MarR family transcriptional regulator
MGRSLGKRSRKAPRSPKLIGQDRQGLRARGKPLLKAPLRKALPSAGARHDDSNLDDFLPYVVLRLSHELTENLVVELRSVGVNLVRWRILAALAMEDGITISEICDRAMMRQSAMSRMLMVMETENYITRRIRRGDERQVQVFLSANGRRLFDSLNTIVRNRQHRILKNFSAREIAQTFSLLRRMLGNLRH